MPDIEAGSKERPFGPHEEKVIISLAFCAPEFFSSVGQHLNVEYFHVPEAQFVYMLISNIFKEHEVVPTRAVVRDAAVKLLTVDDDYEAILEIIDYEPDARDIPVVKESLLEWARDKAYGQVYSDDAIQAYESGDYSRLNEIIEGAQRIVDVSDAGKEFFKTFKEIFIPDTEVKLTTGFVELDRVINEGGPTRKEVFVWMAPTGVGKTMVLINSGVRCFRRDLKVMHVTLELSEFKTKCRYAGAFTRVAINERFENEDRITAILDKERSTHSGDLVIYEFPPEEIHVDTLYQILKWQRRTKGWSPDVLIVDYLELMLSRRPEYNKDDYTRQKRVSTELRGLAKNENVLIFTATQTNRDLSGKKSKDGDGGGGAVIDINRVAESYGKMMPSDYVVSLNQSSDEYHQRRLRFYVAKNRNGPKFKTVSAKVNYESMVVEVDRHRPLR
jgi:replicative DNA helicase